MQVDIVTKVSKAASGLCMFVHAMDVYSKVTSSMYLVCCHRKRFSRSEEIKVFRTYHSCHDPERKLPGAEIHQVLSNVVSLVVATVHGDDRWRR